MGLHISKVPRALEKKNRILGFEIGDIVLIFLYLSVSNFIFGQTDLKFVVVWCGTFILALALYFLKKGKPDNYIQHYGEFMFSQGVFSSGAADIEYIPYFLTSEMESRKNENY